MSYMDVLKQIKKKQIAPIYFLYGSESFFLQQLKQQLIEKVAANDEDSLAVYDLEEVPIEAAVSDAETYPFFSDRKLVIAENPVFLKAKPDKLAFEHELLALERYLSAPVDYSVLVIIAPYEKIDERKKISKLLKKHATVAVCNPIKDNDLRQWVNSVAKQLHVTINDEAYEIMEAELSNNLHQLENELQKLALFVGPNGEVTKKIAEDLVSHTTTSSALRLVDAVIEKDLQKAIRIFKDLLKMKEEPIAMIGLIAFQFRSILRVKLLKQQGYSQYQMQKQLGVHPYVVKIALNRERQFSVDKLERIIIQLADTDAAIKQGKMGKELAFELMLYDLIEAA
ncbi:DNA polymerase III subunit delta [Oceanobacillus alkalisoli]|uniref:DNA polymerase III subunit delta n=1 Tax=Oceanobacillus alkalisoli TaxID=2925113 RepID=UPI001EF13DAB|nr:DNA polymerase III subunit delta [Oceanobacillus alkalisoli]MCF3941823.1 DNA polymerase III subunit delta [Oceanobacillus alkalisoli]MCG5103103.1 DNA polymerase III subunit delta [Oceanobacillus alkalisoli]